MRHPLGLPRGSVRSLVALGVVSAVLLETWRDRPIGLLLTETLLIVLAHYFASRKAGAGAPGKAEGVRGPDPLWLPRYTVRLLIVSGFVGVASLMLVEKRLWESPAVTTLGIVLAYFLGSLVSGLVQWWERRYPGRGLLRRRWDDGKALAALAAAGVLVFVVITDRPETLEGWMEKGVFGVILFYFGSR